MKTFKNCILILILFNTINTFGQSPYATPAQIIIVHATRNATEGDLYLDTVNNDFYIGLTNGELAKIGDTLDETIDTVYVSGDSIVIIEAGDTLYGDLTRFFAGENILKEVTTDINLTGWTNPYTEEPISELNISVPDGKWLEAEYFLIVRTNDGDRGIGFKVKGYDNSTDFISGFIDFKIKKDAEMRGKKLNHVIGRISINNTYYDTDPGTVREQEDDGNKTGIYPENDEALVRISIRYKNLSGSTVVYGYSFGAYENNNNGGLNISVLKGSTVTYTLH
jgi:hypothetical protein